MVVDLRPCNVKLLVVPSRTKSSCVWAWHRAARPKSEVFLPQASEALGMIRDVLSAAKTLSACMHPPSAWRTAQPSVTSLQMPQQCCWAYRVSTTSRKSHVLSVAVRAPLLSGRLQLGASDQESHRINAAYQPPS